MKLPERVWVVGASSGIGEYLARELAGRGCRLVLSARRTELLETIRSSCPDPDRVSAQHLDLAEPAGLAQAYEDAKAFLGSIDLMVLNAGVGQRALLEEMDAEVFHRIMQINFLGPAELTRLALPQLLENRGAILAVTSLAGLVGAPVRTAYAASKHALHGFFASLEPEVAHRGVRVALAVPGFVNTDLPQSALTAHGDPWAGTRSKKKRGIDPEPCAKKIIRGYLAGRRVTYVGFPPIAALVRFLGKWAPGLLARILAKTGTT
jgi:dehydrogenase/reductase SDR family protein 7B